MRHLLKHSACKPDRFGMSLVWGHCGWERSLGWQPASFPDDREHQLLHPLPWTTSCLHRGLPCSFLCLLPSIHPWSAHDLAALLSSEQQQHMAGMGSEMICAWVGVGVCSQPPADWDQDIPGCRKRGASSAVAFSMRFSPGQKGSHWHIHSSLLPGMWVYGSLLGRLWCRASRADHPHIQLGSTWMSTRHQSCSSPRKEQQCCRSLSGCVPAVGRLWLCTESAQIACRATEGRHRQTCTLCGVWSHSWQDKCRCYWLVQRREQGLLGMSFLGTCVCWGPWPHQHKKYWPSLSTPKRNKIVG